MTRTKIERVGGHLLIGDAAIPIASMIVEPTSVSDPYSIEVSDSGRGSICKMSHWTAREVLEVAYGGGEWLCHPKPTGETRALVDEIESQRETIRSLHTALDDLYRACLKMERAKNEEIAELQEQNKSLKAALWSAEHAMIDAVEHLDHGERDEARGLLVDHPKKMVGQVREAAKVGR